MVKALLMGQSTFFVVNFEAEVSQKYSNTTPRRLKPAEESNLELTVMTLSQFRP